MKMKTGPSEKLKQASDNYEAERVSARLENYLKCQRNPNHKIDYICASQDSICDKLICVDCLKNDPVHFNAHHSHFLRVGQFIERVTSSSQKPKRVETIKELAYFERKLRKGIESYEISLESVFTEIKAYYSSVYEKYSKVLKKKCDQASTKIIEEISKKSQNERQSLLKVLDSVGDLSKFSNKGHLLELSIMMDRSANNNEMRKKLTRLNNMFYNLDGVADEWHSKAKNFFDIGDHYLDMRIHLSELESHTVNHEHQFIHLLNSLAPQNSEISNSPGARRILESFSPDPANTSTLIGHLEHSISQIKQKSHLHEGTSTFLIEIGTPIRAKSKKLEEIDKRIQALFNEDPDK